MTETRDKERTRKLLVRGLGWCLCLGVWTVALLTLFPVQIGTAVTPPTLRFPAAKFLHFAAYAFLTVYLPWLPLPRRWRWLLLAFLSFHAAGTEFCQRFVPGRHPAITDVLIDHAGLVFGLALRWKRWLPKSALSNQPSAISSSRSARSDQRSAVSGRVSG